MQALARLTRLVSLVSLICAPLAAQVFQGSLTKPAVVNDNCGYRVAVDGDWAFASRPHPGGYAGEVRAYLRGSTGFAEVQTLTSPVTPPALSYFGIAVAADGGFLAVGASYEGPGRVHLFRLVAGTWVPFQVIGLPSFAQGSIFGHHLALVGQRLLVYYRGTGAGAIPRVQIWAFDGQTWKLEQTIQPPDALSSVAFGWAMALDGDRLALADRQFSQGGRVYLYERDANGWSLKQTLSAPGGTPSGFGAAVALHGGRVLVGAPNDTPFNDNGRLFVFEQVGHAWTVAQQLEYVDPPPQPASWTNIHFGAPIAVSGDWIAVGQDANYNGVLEPAVHLFRREGNAYVAHAKLPATLYSDSDQFGHVLAFGDGTLAVQAFHSVGAMQTVSFDASQLDATLQAWPPVVSIASGGEQSLVLDAGAAHGGDAYLMLGSLSGTAPGIPVGALTVPLNPDAYLMLTLQQAGPITPALGWFGQFGKAEASLILPAGMSASLAGLVAHHAYVVLSPSTFDVELASDPVAVTLVP